MINVEESLGDNTKLLKNIKKEINYIAAFIDYQKNLKEYISKSFDNISLSENKEEDSDEITSFFQRVFEARLNLDCNSIKLQELFKQLRKLKSSTGQKLGTQLNNYNQTYNACFSDISTKTNTSKQIADDLYTYIKQQPNSKISEAPVFETESVHDNYELIVSEKSGKVFLPYSIKELDKILDENPNKYTDKNDLINKKFIIPLSYYKNSSFARFKETYKLVREKEKGSITEAINLAFELFFNYNLDPAIISACKNVDELDIYLDCLDDNELDDFYCFNIVYEVMPAVK